LLEAVAVAGAPSDFGWYFEFGGMMPPCVTERSDGR